MPYAIYLRKSRLDLEAEAHGEGDTLERHRKALLSLAARRQLPVSKIYEEVVSGDTIAARPQMQAMLNDVEDGLWDGVLVMEVERLARGDTIDQGIVAQTFKLTDTKIITPLKSYDPNNEFDEEYFEFGLFMSRREYKTINRRLQRGRMASVREGKWVGNRAPYGYRRVKLEGEKGFTLTPDPETAPVVKSVFDWYASGELGLAAICSRLNRAGILSPSGRDWVHAGLREVLQNPAYCGLIRWGCRPQKKSLDRGGTKKQRVRMKYGEYEVWPGRHEPLISQETFDAVIARLKSHPARPGPRQMAMKNPLSGLCYCSLCGRAMARRPYQKNESQLLCAYPACPTKASYLSVVEDAVLDALGDAVRRLQIGADAGRVSGTRDDVELLESGQSATRKSLEVTEQQQSKLFDLLERGIYSEELFLRRSAELSRRREELERKLTEIGEQLTEAEKLRRNRQEIIPKIQHAIDVYGSCKTPEEKNNLLKSVVERIEYSKTTGGRYQESDMKLYVFPKLV